MVVLAIEQVNGASVSQVGTRHSRAGWDRDSEACVPVTMTDEGRTEQPTFSALSADAPAGAPSPKGTQKKSLDAAVA